MELQEININKLKVLKGDKRKKTRKEYEDEKEKMILKYMEIQDILEDYNQRSYELSCKIEQLNMVLKMLED